MCTSWLLLWASRRYDLHSCAPIFTAFMPLWCSCSLVDQVVAPPLLAASLTAASWLQVARGAWRRPRTWPACCCCTRPRAEGRACSIGLLHCCWLISAAVSQVARGCLEKAKDLAGLLLLHSATGSGQGMADLQSAASAEGKHNVEFLAAFLLGRVGQCVDILIASGRLPEAAFFARTYLPSRISEVRPFSLMLAAGAARSTRQQCVDTLIALGRLPEAALFARTYLPSLSAAEC